MKLLLGIWTLSHLLLPSSSSPCGNQQPWAKADDIPPEQTQEEPWLVSIRGNGHRCQGAVLNNWWILTAASCFLLMEPSYVELLTTGGHFSVIPVSQFLSHQGFSSWAGPPTNDLGLVMLGQPIDLRKRGMWPVCVPDGKESSLIWEHCRIHKRNQDGFKQWLERIAFYSLGMSACTTQWPGTAERWNMCMGRKTYDETDCKVPVGSPVLCHETASDHWELRGLVSQSAANCTSPVLATQVAPHLEWLWEERILNGPVPPALGDTKTTRSDVFSLATEQSPVTAPQLRDMFQTQEEEEEEAAQQPVVSPTEQPFKTTIAASLRTPMTTGPTSPAGLQLPVIPPFTERISGVPQTAAKVKPSLSEIVTEMTVGHSVPVKSFTVQPFAPETDPAISVAYPTPKLSSPVTSTMTMSPVMAATTRSPGTTTTAKSPGTATTTKSPGTTTTAKSPGTAATTKSPGTTTTTKSPGTAATAKSPGTTTTAKSPGTATTTKSPGTTTTAKSPGTATTTKSPGTTTTAKSPGTATTTKSPGTTTTTKSPGTAVTAKSPGTTTTAKSPGTATTTKSPGTTTTAKSPGTATTTKSPGTTTTTKSPGKSATAKSPVTTPRRESHPQTSTRRAAMIVIIAHSTVKQSPTTGRTFRSTTSKAYLTTNKQSYVIPSKKHLPRGIRRPLPEKSTTAGQLSTSVKAASSVASPTTKPTPVTPTRSLLLPAALTVVHSQHVIIIPATTRPSLTSPASKKVSPPVPPSLKSPAHLSANGPFIAAGPHFPKNKFQETVTPGPPLALLTSPNTAVRTTPLPLPRTHVTMEQCEMALAWDGVSQAYKLYKTADLRDREIGCGVRPGFVPRCPGCLEAEAGEFPWVVSLRLSSQHFCAGSILSPWWILTTANCANLIKNFEALVLVQAGRVEISEGTGSVPIRQALTHPGAQANEDLHNLGLLQLRKPLEFGPRIAPVCVSDVAHVTEDFRNCWLPSWTVLQGGPARLLRRPLTRLSISTCHRLEEKLSSAIFCIKAQKGPGGICKGDLGSPLICPDPKDGAWVQLGVLSSFDKACSRPYVFNRLQRYLPWLEKTTKAAGRQDNYTVSWQRQGPTRQLRVLQEPEALVQRISAHSALAWQVLVATCGSRSCGGSILDPSWVLTTARCVRDTNSANIAVFVGLKHPKGHTRGILVAGIYPYEEIPQSNVSGGNVALLLLQDPITFGKYVAPMTLPQADTWDSCKVMGLQTWKPGYTEPDPTAYRVKVLQTSDCARRHPGVNPAVYCVVRSSARRLPIATMGEGAALLCRLEAKTTPWSQVGLTSEPFPGSQPDTLSSSIIPYVQWMEETSKEARHLVLLSHGRTAYYRPHGALLLILSLFGVTELG